jgi:D-aminopeptidase
VRLRDLGIVVGEHPPGPVNAITDVPGVTVGLRTVVADTPRVARTGVTVVLPRGGEEWTDPVFAGYHAFNGNGEITGIPWLLESGNLGSPVAITNTHQVGTIRDALVAHAEARDIATDFHLPVVTETYDGWLNDIAAFHLTAADLEAALAAAAGGDVAEGNVGGGTGMICHEFKGGTGTASRAAGGHTVGALVQANYGARRHLRVDGVAVGRAVGYDAVPAPWPDRRDGGSIVAIVATDAPLLPVQCTRLAGGPPSAWPGWAGSGTTAAATCSSPSPPGTDSPAARRAPTASPWCPTRRWTPCSRLPPRRWRRRSSTPW